MTGHKIFYAKQSVDKQDIQKVVDTLKSPFLTTGPETERFEDSLCQLTQARHAIVCANGTAALHLACLALGMAKNDLGLTSPNSFLASANCIEYCQGRTDFIDLDLDTLCLSPEKLEQYCTQNEVPKLVIPVDFAGIAADLPRIKQLADHFGFYVIEDAAHSIGSFYDFDGRTFQCGSCAHSDLAIFSFHPAKTITAGEGGAVLTNDDDLAARLRVLRSHGMVKAPDISQKNDSPWYYEMEELSHNYRITDFQCALANSQLEQISEFKARRQKIVSMYNTAFQDDPRMILPPQDLAQTACPHLYPIQFFQGSRVRRHIYNSLKAENIFCQVHYIPIYWQPYYAKKYGYAKGRCPNAETYYSRCLSLPLFPALTDREVRFIIEKLLSNLDNIT